jgi:tRNA modification GTPase
VTLPTDTIAALATAPGESAISVIRVSGPESLPIADRIFRCSGERPSARDSHTFVHGHIVPIAGKVTDPATPVDEVILLIYRAPRSYTREDVVEIQGHGGVIAARRILRTLLEAGARMAEPGEFTRRAFLNGRLDLAQAEAVMDLIRARTDRGAKAAIEQLSGCISKWCTIAYDSVVSVAADLEASLDFMEEELPEDVMRGLADRLGATRSSLDQFRATWGEGHILRDGAVVAIVGAPNVGKSTLLNALLGKDRAIVTSTPGTTRDFVEEAVNWDGFPIRLVDTAGIRDTACNVEQEGVRRAVDLIKRADAFLYVVDGSQVDAAGEDESLRRLPREHTLLVVNKIDLGFRMDQNRLQGWQSVSCSLVTGQGVEDIKPRLLGMIGANASIEAHAVVAERHRKLIDDSILELDAALEALKQGDSMVFAASGHVRAGAEKLGQITGRSYYDEMLNAIFSRFCVGK